MNSKRLFRYPWLLVLVGLIVVVIIAGSAVGSGGERRSNHHRAVPIDSGNVSKAIVNDTKQTVELTLKGTSTRAPEGHLDVPRQLQQHPDRRAEQAANLSRRGAQVEHGSMWLSLLTSFLPILLILGLRLLHDEPGPGRR